MAKKLLFVWHDLRIGGSQLALSTLSEYLARTHSITILCHQNIVELKVFPQVVVNYSSAKLDLISGWKRIIDKLRLVKSIFKQAKNHDIIISSEFPLLTIFSYLIAKLQKKPMIVWNHSCRNELNLTKNKLIQLIYKQVLMRTYIINVSFYARSSLNQYLGINTNSNVIYNLLNPNDFIKIFKRPNKDINTFNIVALGSLTLAKNFTLLILAVGQLVTNYKLSLQVNICGDGPEKENLQALINQLNLKAIVHLIGKVDNPKEYIAACDLVVSTSNTESFSLVALEALALNKPIITTNTGAAEIIANGKYGLVIPKGDLAALITAIFKMVKDNSLRESFVAKYPEALIPFNAKSIIKQWNQVLIKVTGLE